MVRSSGHHRKRSRSRSITPDHKRSKSSRDYDKDRFRRRSRSRDNRLRRSRSRDRKKDNKGISESRIRSKPLKLKRRTRSRSRSRSKSKEKNTKKDDKKETKVEDEPFDPTNLDKEADKDEEDEWVVTDVIEEPMFEDNGNFEEEYDYEADEDDQYSNRSASENDSHQSSPDVNNEKATDISGTENDPNQDESVVEDKENENKSTSTGKEGVVIDQELPNENESASNKTPVKSTENVKDRVSQLKELDSDHSKKMKILSKKQEAERVNIISQSHRSYSSHNNSEEVVKLTKEQIRQWMKFDRELHELKIKNEKSRHRAEMDMINAQLNYWKTKR